MKIVGESVQGFTLKHWMNFGTILGSFLLTSYPGNLAGVPQILSLVSITIAVTGGASLNLLKFSLFPPFSAQTIFSAAVGVALG